MSAWLEQAWLARYLDRRLTEEETAAFEAYLLDRPHLLDAVEADNALREAAAGLADLRDDVPGQPGAAGGELHRTSSRAPAWGGMAMAASLAAAVAIGWMLPRDAHDPAVSALAPPRVLYDTTRGVADTPVELVPHAGQAPVFIADIAVPGALGVRSASVSYDGGTFELPVASISSDGFVTWVLPLQWRGHAELVMHLDVQGAQSPTRFTVRL